MGLYHSLSLLFLFTSTSLLLLTAALTSLTSLTSLLCPPLTETEVTPKRRQKNERKKKEEEKKKRPFHAHETQRDHLDTTMPAPSGRSKLQPHAAASGRVSLKLNGDVEPQQSPEGTTIQP